MNNNVILLFKYKYRVKGGGRNDKNNVIILSLCTQRCYGRHNVSRKFVNN